MTLRLEDFAGGARIAVQAGQLATPDSARADGFDAGYSAGWDDAVAQIETENARIGDALAARLTQIEADRDAGLRASLAAFEPLVHDMLDRLLPRAVDRGFVPLLLEEARAVLEAGTARLTLRVGADEAEAVATALTPHPSVAARVAIRPDADMAPSQALLCWEGRERRVDLQAVLTGLDAAFDALLRDAPDGVLHGDPDAQPIGPTAPATPPPDAAVAAADPAESTREETRRHA